MENNNQNKEKVIYTETEISELTEFIRILKEKTKDSHSQGEHLYFRGESSNYNRRIPTLYRQPKLAEHGSEYYYRTLLNELGRDDYGENTSLVRLISELQHYGAVTRMLDVTSNPIVALYFSLEGSDEDDGYVYMYSVKKEDEKFDTGHTVAIKSGLNLVNQQLIDNFLRACKWFEKNFKNCLETTTDELDSLIQKNEECYNISDQKRKIHKTNIVKFMEILNQRARVRERLNYPFKIYKDLNIAHLVLPSKTTDRIRQQQGAFMFPKYVNIKKVKKNIRNKNNKTNKTLKDEVHKQIDKSIQHFSLKDKDKKQLRIKIKGKEKRELKKQLKMIGITEGFIYPDIEHVSKALLETYDEK
ncbi:FRG domain-containing protein [Staphylococcus sp. EZ-P03]|uniref:FRG domain-containing protein n=1 Tax=Staphylococcus sp. EZ-P03 TaxID=2282739 RepID=UPI0013C41589|nr:FRG domain-containing protein [Staphylococcus sp. EZ-P03]